MRRIVFLFGLGIGSDVDRALVEGIAKAGRGRAEFVTNNTEIEQKVMKLYNDAVIPSLSHLKIDWGCQMRQIPSFIPSINQGSRLVVYGLLENGLISEKLILSGVNDERQPLKWVIPVTERKGNTIHKMAAYSLINELYEAQYEEQYAKAEVIKLGIKYQLATKYTSFVATAVNETAAMDTLKSQNIVLQKPMSPEKKQNQKKDKQKPLTLSSSNESMTSPVEKSNSNVNRNAPMSSPPPSKSKKSYGFKLHKPKISLPAVSLSKEKSSTAVSPPSSAKKKSIQMDMAKPGKSPVKDKKGEKKEMEKKRNLVEEKKVKKDVDEGKAKSKEKEKEKEKDEKRKSPVQRKSSSESRKRSNNNNNANAKISIPSSPKGGKSKKKALSRSPKTEDKKKADEDEDPDYGEDKDEDFEEKEESSDDEVEDDEDDEDDEGGDNDSDSPVPAKPSVSGNKDWKTLIISSQQFDGCWDEKALSQILGSVFKDKVIQGEKVSELKVWMTALALAILELKCMDSKTSWEVVANKGRAFMSKTLVSIEKMDKDETVQFVMKLITKAKEILSKLI